MALETVDPIDWPLPPQFTGQNPLSVIIVKSEVSGMRSRELWNTRPPHCDAVTQGGRIERELPLYKILCNHQYRSRLEQNFSYTTYRHFTTTADTYVIIISIIIIVAFFMCMAWNESQVFIRNGIIPIGRCMYVWLWSVSWWWFNKYEALEHHDECNHRLCNQDSPEA